MIDNHDFVKQYCKKLTGKMPNFVCFTNHQRRFELFSCTKGGYLLGIDRTFNLGTLYLAVLVYKKPVDEHLIFMGPIFLNRDFDYNYFCCDQKKYVG